MSRTRTQGLNTRLHTLDELLWLQNRRTELRMLVAREPDAARRAVYGAELGDVGAACVAWTERAREEANGSVDVVGQVQS